MTNSSMSIARMNTNPVFKVESEMRLADTPQACMAKSSLLLASRPSAMTLPSKAVMGASSMIRRGRVSSMARHASPNLYWPVPTLSNASTKAKKLNTESKMSRTRRYPLLTCIPM